MLDNEIMNTTNNLSSRIQSDYSFARENWDEFKGLCPILRYVAALNPEATKKQFVAALVEVGVHKATAAIQFANSRKAWAKDFPSEAHLLNY